MKNFILSLILIIASFANLYSQSKILEGYTYESGNKGYLSNVQIQIADPSEDQILFTTFSDDQGKFSIELPAQSAVVIYLSKDMYQDTFYHITLNDEKSFVKAKMERGPGYFFEITLADKKDNQTQVTDAITGALIEVYNNTTEELELKLEDHPAPEFKVGLKKGNHYTILIRKKGYIAKQIEAYVNVKDCILCFEGVNSVTPGITENLSSNNNNGILLANVEMEKIFSGKSFDIQNIYWDLNSSELKPDSKEELNKIINILRYNPNLTLELGSHTDSRGTKEFNKDLSERRANSAVKFIRDFGGIPKFRIVSAGYGEDQILNDCIDGIKCSEEQHAKNRRTAIKIIGIDDNWVFKPLANIKNEVKFEKEIQKMIQDESKD